MYPLQKFRVIISGLRYAAINDFSVLYKLVLSLVLLIPVLIFNTLIDASLIVLATGVMLTAELFNTAIEAICDFNHPDFDEKIGIIKDIAAAVTGISIFSWMIVLIIEVFELWQNWFGLN